MNLLNSTYIQPLNVFPHMMNYRVIFSEFMWFVVVISCAELLNINRKKTTPILLSKMAARSDAAATPGPKNGVFMSVSLVSSSSNCLTLFKNQKTNTRKHIYDRQSLLDIDNVYKHQLSPATTEKLQGLCLLLKPDPVSRCTFPRVQMLRTRFVNCTAPSANNKQITPTAFSS